VARGSAHIRTQYELLAEEQARAGRRLEKPSRWIIAREEREYDLATRVIVPSGFARESFIQRGLASEKVAVVNLSLRARGFEAGDDIIEQRVQRLRSGAPLRVLYTGMLSYRKGMYDMSAVLRALATRMTFRLVGPVLPECADFARAAAAVAQVQDALPEASLPDVYAWGDVFLLPTLEDGFAVVLAQAQAAGLPIIATTNCGAPDIIAGGGQGFVVPIRNAEAIIERLEWCHEHRAELARMVERLHGQPPRRNWDDVADDFVRAVSP
jgi:glycosyltransferase involved in cell wall biosynthesis